MADASLVTTQTLYTSLSNALNTGAVGGGGSSGSSSTEAFRNMIINGSMIVDQRLEGNLNVTTSNGSYTGPDRFFVNASTTSLPRYSIQRIAVSDADNSVTQQNFSLRMQTTSNVTISGSNLVGIYHVIEGAIAAPLQWGTSNGRSASLSFYIKTNVTGTHWIALNNNASSTSYVSPFTISSTDSYTRITKTIPAPPANTAWDTNSNSGIWLKFDVVQASSQTTTNDAWVSGSYNVPTGTYASNLWSSSNNYVELTGIQFEQGSSATSFEYRPFSLERTLCQRYYEKSFPEGIAPGVVAPQSAPGNAIYMINSNSANPIPFCTTKRGTPTLTFFNPYSSNGNVATDTVYSSNLAVFMPNVNKFGVTSTESNLWNRNVYFNWVANSDYY
jgi:hypothetical protein